MWLMAAILDRASLLFQPTKFVSDPMAVGQKWDDDISAEGVNGSICLLESSAIAAAVWRVKWVWVKKG